MASSSVQAAPLPEVSGQERGRTAVRLWLVVLAGLVVAMVAVGGATRLTGSGLSITEWRPVTGALPPLSHEAWLAEFAKYRQSPQYELLNRGMALAEFQFIYWWEWGHRQLGRLIGIAFFVPLLWFWARGQVRGGAALSLVGIGLLGGLQGAVGWIMVASGLEPGMIAVAPVKLALHLVLASVILACLVWMATGLREPVPARLGRDPRAGRPPRSRTTGRGIASHGGAYLLIGLVVVQIALGGLVAGARAGWIYNTWPLMDGRLIPPAAVLFSSQPLVENLVDNLALVQLNHRLGAYLLLAVALWHAFAVRQTGAARRAAILVGLILSQTALGIVTLVLAVPLAAGLAHQVMAMVVLAFATVHARRCTEAAPIPAPIG